MTLRTALSRCTEFLVASLAIGCTSVVAEGTDPTAKTTAALEPALDLHGVGETTHLSGAVDRTNPFFQSLGTNGRTCESCHDARAGWTMTPVLARILFERSGGTSPLFRPHDQANRPDADVSTVAARRVAYSMLLTKGLTRFTRVPVSGADYTVVAVDDPYGFSTPTQVSNFRRPISVANVALEPSATWTTGPLAVRTALMNMMNNGTKTHAQGTTDVPIELREAGADFMLGLFFAQSYDFAAGRLDSGGAFGGPAALSTQPFYLGINALTGDAKTGAPFDNESFKVFEAWEDLDTKHANHSCDGWQAKARAAIARGEEAFYSIEFDITGVAGLDDELGRPVIKGTCTTCHNTPNVGSGSVFRMVDTGVADAARRTYDMPLVTVRNDATGETRQSTDLGRAFVTGKWADIGKFKIPTLRGLAARAPYFHDGSAANLRQVVEFYKKRFNVDFKGREDDLVAFLQSL